MPISLRVFLVFFVFAKCCLVALATSDTVQNKIQTGTVTDWVDGLLKAKKGKWLRGDILKLPNTNIPSADEEKDMVRILESHPDSFVRAHAARVLGEWESPTRLRMDALATALIDEDPEVCCIASYYLSRIGNIAVPSMLRFAREVRPNLVSKSINDSKNVLSEQSWNTEEENLRALYLAATLWKIKDFDPSILMEEYRNAIERGYWFLDPLAGVQIDQSPKPTHLPSLGTDEGKHDKDSSIDGADTEETILHEDDSDSAETPRPKRKLTLGSLEHLQMLIQFVFRAVPDENCRPLVQYSSDADFAIAALSAKLLFGGQYYGGMSEINSWDLRVAEQVSSRENPYLEYKNLVRQVAERILETPHLRDAQIGDSLLASDALRMIEDVGRIEQYTLPAYPTPVRQAALLRLAKHASKYPLKEYFRRVAEIHDPVSIAEILQAVDWFWWRHSELDVDDRNKFEEILGSLLTSGSMLPSGDFWDLLKKLPVERQWYWLDKISELPAEKLQQLHESLWGIVFSVHCPGSTKIVLSMLSSPKRLRTSWIFRESLVGELASQLRSGTITRSTLESISKASSDDLLKEVVVLALVSAGEIDATVYAYLQKRLSANSPKVAGSFMEKLYRLELPEDNPIIGNLFEECDLPPERIVYLLLNGNRWTDMRKMMGRAFSLRKEAEPYLDKLNRAFAPVARLEEDQGKLEATDRFYAEEKAVLAGLDRKETVSILSALQLLKQQEYGEARASKLLEKVWQHAKSTPGENHVWLTQYLTQLPSTPRRWRQEAIKNLEGLKGGEAHFATRTLARMLEQDIVEHKRLAIIEAEAEKEFRAKYPGKSWLFSNEADQFRLDRKIELASDLTWEMRTILMVLQGWGVQARGAEKAIYSLLRSRIDLYHDDTLKTLTKIAKRKKKIRDLLLEDSCSIPATTDFKTSESWSLQNRPRTISVIHYDGWKLEELGKYDLGDARTGWLWKIFSRHIMNASDMFSVQKEFEMFLNPREREAHGGGGSNNRNTLTALPPCSGYLKVGLDMATGEFGKSTDSLQQVFEGLYKKLRALDSNYQLKVWEYPQGVAMMTMMEYVDEWGNPIDGKKRWTETKPQFASYTDMVRRLFLAPVGYHRCFIFLFLKKGNELVFVQGAPLPQWAEGGDEVPEKFAEMPFGDFKAYILVYSYQRLPGGDVKLLHDIGPADHFKKSGFQPPLSPL